MKSKSLLFLAVFSCALLFSCGKDEDNKPAPNNSEIVGSWNLLNIYHREYTNGELTGGDTTVYSANGVNLVKLTFKADLSWQITASQIADIGDLSSGWYALKGDSLFLSSKDTDSGDTTTLPLLYHINGTEMEWNMRFSGSDGNTTYEDKTEFHFTKAE